MSIASSFAGHGRSGDEIGGLTQAEAEARYVPGQDNGITFKEGRSAISLWLVRATSFSVTAVC